MQEPYDLGELANLEQTFFETGYKDGYDHGRIHGLIEGRQLGREKGFEMWEELGYYQGFASFWRARENGTESRANHHITHLLQLISQFPLVNPSTISSNTDDQAVDIMKLLSNIRSRYKALSSTLGVRPRQMVATAGVPGNDADANGDSTEPTGSRQSVWRLDNRPANGQSLGF